MFTNAPFKTKSRNKQRSIVTDISSPPSLSNSQFIDRNIQEQLHTNPTTQQCQSLPSHRAIDSTNLTRNFVHFAGNNSHSFNDELTSSSKRYHHHSKKMINDIESEQHAYANLSFNDTVNDDCF